MKRIYLASDLGTINNWNRLHGKPMRRRSHVNILASRRLDAGENHMSQINCIFLVTM